MANGLSEVNMLTAGLFSSLSLYFSLSLSLSFSRLSHFSHALVTLSSLTLSLASLSLALLSLLCLLSVSSLSSLLSLSLPLSSFSRFLSALYLALSLAQSHAHTSSPLPMCYLPCSLLEPATYYLTLDAMMAETNEWDNGTNMLAPFLGDYRMQVLSDLFSWPLGPRLRIIVSHGVADPSSLSENFTVRLCDITSSV